MGDTCEISLPKWVRSVGKEDPDIYYTDRAGTQLLAICIWHHAPDMTWRPCPAAREEHIVLQWQVKLVQIETCKHVTVPATVIAAVCAVKATKGLLMFGANMHRDQE